MKWIFLLLPLGLYGQWAEDTLAQMTVEEKIGQLFVIPACEFRGEDHRQDLQRLIVQEHVGSVIFKQGTCAGQVAFYNALQKMAKIPLLCMQDAEPGLMTRRVLDLSPWPKNLTLGAIQNLDLIEQLGQELGKQCRALGFSISLSPVVDVNSNLQNPIIGMRSFGNDPQRVALYAEAYLRGLQSSHVLACAKHFPGHGDTSVDSHHSLPLVDHPIDTELLPFKKMVEAGVPAIMTAHLFIPSLDPSNPVTFSKKVVQGIAREQMGFQGLLITDALNMGALSSYSAGEGALKAFLAGHDCLLYGDHIAPNIDQLLRSDIPEAIQCLRKAYASDVITKTMLDERVLRILRAKEQAGLPLASSLKPFDLPPSGLKQRLYEEAITLVRDRSSFLPITDPISLVCIGQAKTLPQLLPSTPGAERVVVALYDTTVDIQLLLSSLREQKRPFALVIFGTPYVLPKFDDVDCVLMVYEDDPDAEAAAARVMRGTLSPQGHLPVRVNTIYEK